VKPVDISEYQYLLNRIRSLPPMTIEERRRQAISFAYGNAKLSNPNVTREMVERAYEDCGNVPLGLYYQRVCPLCGSGFATMTELDRHLEARH
jgi:hypothetical protein